MEKNILKLKMFKGPGPNGIIENNKYFQINYDT